MSAATPQSDRLHATLDTPILKVVALGPIRGSLYPARQRLEKRRRAE
jgi:hypothetical protein